MSKIKSGIYPKHLMSLIIKPTLKYLDMDSPSARLLMIATAAQESRLGRYLKQLKGPALGAWQPEPDTHLGMYENWINFRPELLEKFDVLSSEPDYRLRTNELATNLSYCCAIARVKYWRVKESLPEYGDVDGMAVYWKKYYNTVKGKGTVEEFIRVYHKYVEGQL